MCVYVHYVHYKLSIKCFDFQNKGDLGYQIGSSLCFKKVKLKNSQYSFLFLIKKNKRKMGIFMQIKFLIKSKTNNYR